MLPALAVAAFIGGVDGRGLHRRRGVGREVVEAGYLKFRDRRLAEIEIIAKRVVNAGGLSDAPAVIRATRQCGSRR